MEEAFIRLHNPLVNLLMRSATERRIRAHFAVTKLIVPAFRNIKGNWSVSRNNKLALAIAERIVPGMSAGAPVVFFPAE
jgi:hypothetical protein